MSDGNQCGSAVGLRGMNIHRRNVLAALAAVSACSSHQRRVPTPAGRAGVGLQLWSVRDACAANIDATLAEVAASGFEGVEFAGHYKYEADAKALRKKLDQLGLRSAGSHLSIRALRHARLGQTIDFYATLGARLLIVGGDERFTDPEGSKAYAQEMNRAAVALQRHGLFCGHHNHAEEFTKAGDTTYWHLFADRTAPQVFLQLDVGWALAAGLDPIALMKKYRGRIKTVHLKTPPGMKGGEPFIGNRQFNWEEIVSTCLNVGGAEWLIVEQGDYPAGMSPMQSAQRSLRGLKEVCKRVG